jgi:hypothetical protein
LSPNVEQAFESILVSSTQCCSSQGGHYEVLKHQAYSTDLSPSDCYLFPNIKKHLKGRKFPSIEEATLVADRWIAAQPTEFFFYELKKIEKKVIIVWSSGGICRVNIFLQSRSLLFF